MKNVSASDKYEVKIRRGEINVPNILPNIISSIFDYWERDWRTNFVEIINIKDSKVIKTIDCSVDYLKAQARKKIIADDLSNLSIEEFEEKYINIKERELDSKELMEKLIIAIVIVLIILFFIWIEFSLIKL